MSYIEILKDSGLDVELLQRIRDGKTPQCFVLKRASAELLAAAYLELLERVALIDRSAADMVARLADVGVEPPAQTEDVHVTLENAITRVIDGGCLDVKCIGCGCMQLKPCDPPCAWVAMDYRLRVGLCSTCDAKHFARWLAGDRTITTDPAVPPQLAGNEPTVPPPAPAAG